MFFTANLSTTEVSNITEAEKITEINLQVQAGQVSENVIFRVGNDDGMDLTYFLYTSDNNLSLSIDAEFGGDPAIDVDVADGKVSTAIFVRLTAQVDAQEVEAISAIHVNSDPYVASSLTVNEFIVGADEGQTEFSAYNRMGFGEATAQVLEQIEIGGEALSILEYTPLSKPREYPEGLHKLSDRENLNISQWVNFNNHICGYMPTAWHTKGWVGNRQLEQEVLKALAENTKVMPARHDIEKIILPADFEGFDPGPYQYTYFGQITPNRKGWQRTQWILRRHDGLFHIDRIIEAKYFQGQFLFYLAELRRVHYPGSQSTSGYLPWNLLYDAKGLEIDYVRSWSEDVVISEYEYDPYTAAFTTTTIAAVDDQTPDVGTVVLFHQGPPGPSGPMGGQGDEGAVGAVGAAGTEFLYDVIEVSGDYIVADDVEHIEVDATSLDDAKIGNGITIVLPTPLKGRIINVKKIDETANDVIISAGSYTIDGASTSIISYQFDSVSLIGNEDGQWSIY